MNTQTRKSPVLFVAALLGIVALASSACSFSGVRVNMVSPVVDITITQDQFSRWSSHGEFDVHGGCDLLDDVSRIELKDGEKLLQTEIAMSARRRPETLTAYDFYLRAVQAYHSMTHEGLTEAIRLAHRALELDPRFGFVAALAGVCHLRNVLLGSALDPESDRKEAVRLLRLALSVDDGDPDTLAMACLVSAFMVGDCESEIEMADRAVALNPNSSLAWTNRGWVYKIAALPEEAVRSFERAIRMSPVDPRQHLTFGGMGMAFIELGRFDEAIVAGKKAQRQNPSYSGAYRCLVSAFAHLECDAEARGAANACSALLIGRFSSGGRWRRMSATWGGMSRR